MTVFPNPFSMKEPPKQFSIFQGTPISENFKGQEKLLAGNAMHFLLKHYQKNMFLNNATVLFEEVRMLLYGS
jgi:hypothetical protein